jgi:hypothetical protein
MAEILKQLKAYLRTKSGDHLPYHEMLSRLIKKVETENVDERDLIIHSLSVAERIELRQRYDALEIATRNRRDLQEYFDEAKSQAIAQRDALVLRKLERLQKTLDNPPDKTRTLDQETIDLALEVWGVQMDHPSWSLKDIAVKHFGDINEYERMKKATQRVRKVIKKSKSVP